MPKFSPIIFWSMLPAVVGEAVQHCVEVYFGMYVPGDGIAAGSETYFRMASAAVKVLGFVVTVILARRATVRNSVRFEPSGLARYVPIAGLIVAHYVLNYAAVGKSAAVIVVLVSIDCFVIGFLAFAIGSILPVRRRRYRN